ncbi:MAG: Hpt domain-containing protein [Anaerovibrio sp.]|uniref:Hpt domain-containing protein n=1 Tax=Anaerovibrio sp. TaxID=1872532 RepID=UPI0025CDB484|nr:Hpt domain-containing protein [Anaerovibrio sp.]MCR5176398.1 Hpt domain-containing protein [Anaerovibrio sp.]
MDAKTFYTMIEGNYDLIQSRRWDIDRIKRFLKLFLNDESYTQLKAALDAGDTSAAFAAAHTLKGVCGNMAFAKLQETASMMTEALRSNQLEQGRDIMPLLTAEYEHTINAINQFLND